MMPPITAILKEAIRERVEDLLYLLVILAIVGFCFGGFLHAVSEVQGRNYAGVTEWAEVVKGE